MCFDQLPLHVATKVEIFEARNATFKIYCAPYDNNTSEILGLSTLPRRIFFLKINSDAGMDAFLAYVLLQCCQHCNYITSVCCITHILALAQRMRAQTSLKATGCMPLCSQRAPPPPHAYLICLFIFLYCLYSSKLARIFTWFGCFASRNTCPPH